MIKKSALPKVGLFKQPSTTLETYLRVANMPTIFETLEFARQHQQAGRLVDAADICCKILQQQPKNIYALHLLGAIAVHTGKIEEGIRYYQQAIALEPNFAQAHRDLGLALLLNGDFSQGFAEYEWRWHCPDSVKRDFSQPLWDGSELKGATILLHAEPGLGNTNELHATRLRLR